MGLACLLLLGVAILSLPKTAFIALLDLLILFTGVVLTGGFHEVGIDNLAFVERQTYRLNRHLKNTFIVMLNPLRFYMVRRFREVESDEVSFGFSSCVEVVSQLVPST